MFSPPGRVLSYPPAMIHPAPTSKIDPRLARGTLARVVPAIATRPGYLVATYPNTNYELHLHASGTVSTPVLMYWNGRGRTGASSSGGSPSAYRSTWNSTLASG